MDVQKTLQALTIINQLKDYGYSFGYWATCTLSSVMRRPTVAFTKSVYPPEYLKIGLKQSRYSSGSGDTFEEAVWAALAELKKVDPNLPFTIRPETDKNKIFKSFAINFRKFRKTLDS